MNIEDLKNNIREVVDFPIKGIRFKDLTTIYQNPEALKILKDETVKLYQNLGITKVLGIESRGFILAPSIAMELNAGFVPIRKPSKLPYKTIEVSYAKEYGLDRIQMHVDALKPDDIVLVHDDLLATGGSMAAAVKLIQKAGVKKIYINFSVELEELQGRKKLKKYDVTSLIRF